MEDTQVFLSSVINTLNAYFLLHPPLCGGCLRLSLFYTYKLICVRAHFHTDIASGENANQGHLQMILCPKRRAKILILSRCAYYIRNKRLGSVIGIAGVTTVPNGTMTFHILHFLLYGTILCSMDTAVNIILDF